MHRRRRLGVVVLLGAAGCASGGASGPRVGPVRPGLDVLVTDSLHLVEGLRVGLLTNPAGVDHLGRSAVVVLREAGVTLTALYSPEHGFTGQAAPGERIASSTDTATGLPIYSLYGSSVPVAETLEPVDVLLVDLQDVGARYFTWLATLVTVQRAAAPLGKRVIVLDRPNPIGGAVQGNVLDTAFRSGVGMLAVPMRHGLTFGELALMAQADLHLPGTIEVVPAAGWRRDLLWDHTGLPFVPPSPNLRELDALLHYPGLCLFEATALSVGRGTDAPFRQIGAPWLDTTAVLDAITAAGIQGVRFRSVVFTPEQPGDGKYPDRVLAGIRLEATDRDSYDPTRVAVVLLDIIGRVHPDSLGIDPPRFDRLAGGDALRLALARGVAPGEIASSWRTDIETYRARRAPWLLYP